MTANGTPTDLISRPALRQTVAEFVALLSPTPTVSLASIACTAPEGDGHAVLVLPGWLRGDPFTAGTRQLLRSIGYTAHGWGLGVNVGPTQRLLSGARDRLVELSDTHGPVSIVGFSMGGLFARWLSLQLPDRVRQVITVCSPIHEPARNFWLPLEPLLGLWPGSDLHKLADEIARPLPVPCVALFSREDGLVNCDSCWDAHIAPEDNIEISGPHVLIACNAQVLAIVAQRLATKET